MAASLAGKDVVKTEVSAFLSQHRTIYIHYCCKSLFAVARFLTVRKSWAWSLLAGVAVFYTIRLSISFFFFPGLVVTSFCGSLSVRCSVRLAVCLSVWFIVCLPVKMDGCLADWLSCLCLVGCQSFCLFFCPFICLVGWLGCLSLSG